MTEQNEFNHNHVKYTRYVYEKKVCNNNKEDCFTDKSIYLR